MDQTAKTKFQQVVPLHTPSLSSCWVPYGTDKNKKPFCTPSPIAGAGKCSPSSLHCAAEVQRDRCLACMANRFQEPAKQRSQWGADSWERDRPKSLISKRKWERQTRWRGSQTHKTIKWCLAGIFWGGIHGGNRDELELEMGRRKPSNKWCVLCK